MKKSLLIIISAILMTSCTGTSQKEETHNINSPCIADKSRSIPIYVNGEDTFKKLDEYLIATSYIKLAPEPLLANIKGIRIYNERIYVWDRSNQLVCYDMQGKMIYRINSIGNGPGEYSEINAFTINPDKAEFVIYDNSRISLLYYSLIDGKYLRTEPFSKPNPSEIAYFDHVFFYNNRNHWSYPDDSLLHYSLLVSPDGLKMNQHYFPHNEAEEKYIFSPSMQTFYDNEKSLYYCRNFDNIVYQLGKDSLIARYRIDLPNPLPFSKIEERANEQELIKSGYAFGISNVYECDSLLYFRFLKDGYFMAALYDLAKDKQICCVKTMQEEDNIKPTLPIFDIINGVYKGKFFGVLSPGYIDYSVSKHPEKFPELFQQYDAQSDNPVIGFYEVAK